ncbi:MAG: DUF2628 domain-containing protein [Hyphomicrobiales bacterium]
MTIYLAYSPSVASGDEADLADEVVFIKDAFSWGALIFGPIWLIANRMWLVLAGWLVVVAALSALDYWLGGPGPAVVNTLFNLLFALEANNLKGWTLEKKGWQFLGVAAGHDQDESERKYFADWQRHKPDHFKLQPATRKALAPRQIVGVFPTPGGTK